MPHRAHLFSLRIANAVRESCIKEPYSFSRFFRDLLAGTTVGIIAIPLAMALAIASGVPPQHGLYTAFIGGFIIALTGGSRFSVSGPTAAFVVILYPVTQQFGLAGLLVATFLSGIILVVLAMARLGRFIEYIPESVTFGFTSGIAIVIATLQIKDFFGLDLTELPENYIGKVILLLKTLPDFDLPSTFVALLTLFIMLLWPRLKTPIPGHLIAVIVSTLVAYGLKSFDYSIATIGSRFSFTLPDGTFGHGIAPMLPAFEWPWLQPGPNHQMLDWNFATIEALLPAAFSIAMLGAIESLLCAVVLDGMTGKRHSANSELLGQGLGNMVVPFFGGITATAAIARSAANIKAGAESPIASMIHALVVLLGLLLFAPLLSYLPMSAMAALLVMVAWNISEAPKVVKLIKKSPSADVAVLVVCLSLTVLFDMVIAITVGIVLAALMFMREIAEMTKVIDISDNSKYVPNNLPAGWRVLKINGPLFFAAADRIFSELGQIAEQQAGLILVMDAVPILDGGGLAAMEKFVDKCRKAKTNLIFCDLQFQPLKTLSGAGIKPIEGVYSFTPSLDTALGKLSSDIN